MVPIWEGIKGVNLHVPVQKAFPNKLKGADLPKFSGEDKADYEPRKAARPLLIDWLFQ